MEGGDNTRGVDQKRMQHLDDEQPARQSVAKLEQGRHPADGDALEDLEASAQKAVQLLSDGGQVGFRGLGGWGMWGAGRRGLMLRGDLVWGAVLWLFHVPGVRASGRIG